MDRVIDLHHITDLDLITDLQHITDLDLITADFYFITESDFCSKTDPITVFFLVNVMYSAEKSSEPVIVIGFVIFTALVLVIYLLCNYCYGVS